MAASCSCACQSLAGRASWMEQPAGVELVGAGDLSALHLSGAWSVMGTVSMVCSLLLYNTALLPGALHLWAGD